MVKKDDMDKITYLSIPQDVMMGSWRCFRVVSRLAYFHPRDADE